VYINDYETVHDAEEGIGGYMSFYNHERNYKTPAEVYFDEKEQRVSKRYLKQGELVSD